MISFTYPDSKSEFFRSLVVINMLSFNPRAKKSWVGDPDGSGEPSTVASGVGSAYEVRGLGSGVRVSNVENNLFKICERTQRKQILQNSPFVIRCFQSFSKL